MVSVCLPSDALLQHLLSYLGFSYLGRGVSLYGCSSKAKPLLLTLGEGYLLTATPPDLEHGIAPLSPPVPTQPPLLNFNSDLFFHYSFWSSWDWWLRYKWCLFYFISNIHFFPDQSIALSVLLFLREWLLVTIHVFLFHFFFLAFLLLLEFAILS